MKNIKNNILYFLMVLPAGFVLVNKFPYLLIASVFISIIIGFVFYIKKPFIVYGQNEILFLLIIVFTYFILSYFISGQNFKNLFNFHFLRNDGNFFFCYILFFPFALSALNHKTLANYYFKLIFFIFSLFSFIGLIDFAFKNWKLFTQTDPETGLMYTALNFAHNATGSAYALACVFILVFFLNAKKFLFRFLYLFILFLNIVALFLTKSRASYIGFIVAALIIIFLNFKSLKKTIITLISLIVVLTPVIIFTGTYKRILQIFDFSSATIVIRSFIWQKCLLLFSLSPLFGIGFGRFNDIFNIDKAIFNINRLKGVNGLFSLYVGQNFVFDSSNAHNSYLHFLAETGIIGFLLITFFWIFCLIKITNAYFKNNEEFDRKVFLSSIGTIISLLVMSFFENFLSATTVMILASIIIPISLSLTQVEKYLLSIDRQKLNNRNF